MTDVLEVQTRNFHLPVIVGLDPTIHPSAGRKAAGWIPASAGMTIKMMLDIRALAWWIHDHLPYHSQFYFKPSGVLNLGWRENPERWIRSWVASRGYLTKEGEANWGGTHAGEYGWIEEAAMNYGSYMA